jgi:hypothetical protein
MVQVIIKWSKNGLNKNKNLSKLIYLKKFKFFWDINLDLRDSQRRENEPLLDESIKSGVTKNPTLSWSSKFYITFGSLGLAYYMPDICEKTHIKGYIGL